MQQTFIGCRKRKIPKLRKGKKVKNIQKIKNMGFSSYTLVDGTSMNEECVAVDAVGSMHKLQPRVDRQVCAVRFLT